MKRVLLTGVAAVASLAIAAAANATTVNLATGYSGGVLATSGDQQDDSWIIGHAPSYYANPPHAFTVFSGNADWSSSWAANGPKSDWIAANPDNVYNGGGYYRAFTLTAAQAATASITGAWADDQGANLYLNGRLVSTVSDGQSGSLTSFSTIPFDFISGLNTITIQSAVGHDHAGARFQGILTYASGVPEPATWAMMLLGLGAIGVGLRSNRGKMAGLRSA